MQSTSCKMLAWVKHKLESRLPGEISVTSDTQMTSPLWNAFDFDKVQLLKGGGREAAWVKRQWEGTFQIPLSIPEGSGHSKKEKRN